MEKKMETTMGFGVLLGVYWDNGKANGNYYFLYGIYWV